MIKVKKLGSKTRIILKRHFFGSYIEKDEEKMEIKIRWYTNLIFPVTRTVKENLEEIIAFPQKMYILYPSVAREIDGKFFLILKFTDSRILVGSTNFVFSLFRGFYYGLGHTERALYAFSQEELSQVARILGVSLRIETKDLLESKS